jgi:glycosyltransferase involved in cell wall biosynthesis
MLRECKVSVVMPVYNQFDSLKLTLSAFQFQVIDPKYFEIIVVDDGSTDNLGKDGAAYIRSIDTIQVIYSRLEHSGRSVARNVGIKKAKGDLIVFCDSDRMPMPHFLSRHYALHQTHDIVIGCSCDYFGKQFNLQEMNWDHLKQYSRIPNYLKRISAIYNTHGDSDSPLTWLSFLVGNSSVKKYLLQSAGYFDERFVDWGFEHFELGYRMYKMGLRFHYEKELFNFHIPHAREHRFYSDKIVHNCKMIKEIHTELNDKVIESLLLGHEPVAQYENLLINYE